MGDPVEPVEGKAWVQRRLRFERLLDDLVATARPGDEPTTEVRDRRGRRHPA